MSEPVILVEILELTGSFEEFAETCNAAVRRLETEGIRSLASIQFYSDPDSTQVGAVLTFADTSEMIRHVRMITGWEEFHRLIRMVKPIEVRVHGSLPAEVEAWIRQTIAVERVFPHFVAGFVR